MFIRDLRIKHLNAFICQWLKIDESDIHGYFFDDEVYYETDYEDNRIEDSDFECLHVVASIDGKEQKIEMYLNISEEEFVSSRLTDDQ